MADPNTSALIVSSESSEQSGTHMMNPSANPLQPLLNQQGRTSPHGSVAILWDIENCPVPSDVRPEDVAGNIRMALRVHPVIRGAVTMFSAYGDFNAFPRRLREGCQRTGVKLIDVPNGRKDAADKAILVDMFLFALDNPPPSSIMLISGDVDFAPALHILGQRGYTVILVIPSGVGVASALCNAGRFVWDWPSVARGEGFVPPTKVLIPPHGQNEEEAIVYRGMSQGPISYGEQNESTLWVQPGDLNGLKAQLVKLLELSGGCLPLARIPSDYQKLFGRPLYVSEYGAFKLVNLFKKMADTLAVEGKGHRKLVYLRNSKAGPSAPPLIMARKEKKGKGIQEENMDNITGCGSSDECEINDQNIEQFKHELQEILVSYSCRIFLGCFEAIYQQRYKKPLDYRKFGVNELEGLFDKVKDVVVLHEEPVTKRKFLDAVGG
ncbi:unnamed protein product, partial [Vitis vinifera]